MQRLKGFASLKEHHTWQSFQLTKGELRAIWSTNNFYMDLRTCGGHVSQRKCQSPSFVVLRNEWWVTNELKFQVRNFEGRLQIILLSLKRIADTLCSYMKYIKSFSTGIIIGFQCFLFQSSFDFFSPYLISSAFIFSNLLHYF